MNATATGFLAALTAALIGAGWQIVTRFGVTSTVDAYDLALIRYAVPAILLGPFLLRHGLFPSGCSRLLLAAIVIGGGLPFGLLVMLGASAAPVTHIAVLIPGTMPLFVALMAWLVLKEPITKRKAIAFTIIACGIGCIGWEAVATMGIDTILGDSILLAAALLWGVYSVAFRKSGLSPWHAAAIIAFWSALLAGALWLIGHGDGLRRTSMSALMIQIVWQGLLAGVIGMWVYGLAMQKIGPARAATIGALVPALAGIGGWLILSEEPSFIASVGIALTVCGVALANMRASNRPARSPAIPHNSET